MRSVFLITTRNRFGVFGYGKALFLFLLMSACLASSLPAGHAGQPSPVDNMIFPYSQGIRNVVMTSGDACPAKEDLISKTPTLRMPFIANNGQVDEQVKFYAKTFGGTMFVTKEGEIVYALPCSEKAEDSRHEEPPQINLNRLNWLDGLSSFNTLYSYLNYLNPSNTIHRSISLKETILGAKVGEITGEQPAVTTVNYFKGIDKSKWKTNVPTYNMVNLGEIYEGIELRLKAYGNNVEKLFTVKPGASPEQIRIRLDGIKDCGLQNADCGIKNPNSKIQIPKLQINNTGELEAETELGVVKFTKPVAYQEIDGKRVEVECEYTIAECGVQNAEITHPLVPSREGINPQSKIHNPKSEYGFTVASYDKTKELIIDPLLASTFLGGSKADECKAIAIDSEGNVYVTGVTYSSNLLATSSAYDTDTSFNGGSDVFVSKFNGDLTSLLASTYLGGSDKDFGNSIAIDSNGNIYLTGWTYSSNFPITTGAYDTSFNKDSDVFISKLNGTLTNLLASTYLGGSDKDFGKSIAINKDGIIYLTGYTDSSDFPTTAGALNTSKNGYTDVFVSKLNETLTNLLASTYLGGSNPDYGNAIIAPTEWEVNITGSTQSSDFPTTPDAYDTSLGGESDAFVTILDAIDLSAVFNSTYLGGSSSDFGTSIARDWVGLCIMGGTDSSDFPTTTGAYDISYNGNKDVFVSKLNWNLGTLVASTYLGGSSDDEGKSLAVDLDESYYVADTVYVIGETESLNFPTTPDAYDTSFHGIKDVFISKLRTDLSDIGSSTFLGGKGSDSGNAIAMSFGRYYYDNRIIYVAGKTDSSDFPTTKGAYDTSVNGGTDTFVSKIDSSLSKTLPSSIEITDIITPPDMTFGESLTIKGKISPSHQALVTLTFTDYYSSELLDTVTVVSSQDGFSLTNYFPKKGGYIRVVASWEGDWDHKGAVSGARGVFLIPATFTYTVEASSYAIQLGETVDVFGVVTLIPDNETTRKKFLEEKLMLLRINPIDYGYEDVIETLPFLVGNQVQYKLKDVPLPAIGGWAVAVATTWNETFSAIDEHTNFIEVKVEEAPIKTAGYAILVEGRVQGNAGINSHNLTTNYIYKKLVERGLTEKDIYYFNYKTQGGVDEKPTKDGILKAITIWARAKMNKSPAPLYIIFVGHGKEGKFFIYPESIDPGDLSDALNNLESELNKAASEEPVVVVLGNNHSGSFVKALSKPDTHRIIIASSDSKETAYQGPLPPGGTIRQGDYFTSELFKYAAMGVNLKKSYEKAAKEIAVFTRNENGNGLGGESAGNGQYFDKSAQHPLLDDNGDGIGTYGELSSLSGRDGARASNLILGNNTIVTSLELTKVTDVISLEATDGPPTLFAQVNDKERVDKIWTEIASPGHSLPYNKTATEQQIVNLPTFSYNYFDTAEEKYIWNDFSDEQIDNFREAGEYEVFYFARDVDTGDITTLKDSNVYRNAQGNQKPMPFNLISPLDGETTPVALIFDWDDSADNDGDAVKYTLTISKSMSFDTIDYQLKDITASAAVADKTAALGDDVTYYWRVTSIDARGGTTFMGGGGGDTGKPFVSEPPPPNITANLSEGLLGFISGYVYDVMMSSAKISGAKVTVDGITGVNITTSQGLYIIGPLPSGSYTLRASASGYGQGIGSVRVDGINESFLDIGLTRTSNQATISGAVYIKLPKGTRRAGNAIVGVHTDLNLLKNGQTIAKTTTKLNGSYTIQLNPGDYYMRAIKTISSGANAGTYRGFYNNSGSFHLGAGENKTGCDVTITK